MTDENAPAAKDSDSKDLGAAYDAMLAKQKKRSYNRQISHQGSDQGWTATGTLLSGIIMWGLIGWGLQAWTGWIGWLPIGVLLGAGLGIYLVTKQADNPPPLMDISKAQDGGASLFGPPRKSNDEGHNG